MLAKADSPVSRPGQASLPLEIAAYRFVTRAARPFAGIVLGIRSRRGKEDPARRGERLGIASVPRPAGQVAWFHAASVGEASSVLPLVAALHVVRPDIGLVLTTGTVTSARFVASRLPAGAVHQYVPLDSHGLVGRFLDHWRPTLSILTEQEVWPNLVLETDRRGVPIVLVNARMSARSFERWHRRPRIAAALLGRISVVLAQNDAMAQRFVALGAPNVVVAGNLKIDAPPPPVSEAAKAGLEAALAGRPRFLAASTHDGEEAIVAEAHRLMARRMDGLCTIVAPRHPERGPALADMFAARGFRVGRRSLGELPVAATEIYVADTIGELGTLYATCPVAFVGGSLIGRGGQNPIEAVRHGAAVLVGPSRHNFEDTYGALLSAGAVSEVSSATDIAREVESFASDPARLGAVQAKARLALEGLSGALPRSLATLLDLVPAPEGEAERAPR
jgi:3-deoxy-D-manno-octulosonic-acid transferase